jgi:CHASE2 domain-containing sensor protein
MAVFERAVLARLASWSDRRVLLGLVLAFSGWVVVDVFFLGVSGGIAQTTYDAMVRARLTTAPHDERIVIVDIDEAALARMATEFGRWPWPRDTLATVLDHIESQKPAAVVWDIVFSDADRLSPGGDAAMDQAAQRSQHSHFSVVRLPTVNDDKSDLRQKHLPSLWAQGRAENATSEATLALIPPVLPHVAAQPLGYNNGYVDTDGMLRRYRYFERLKDGSIIQSLPMSVTQSVDPAAYGYWLAHFKNKHAKRSHPEDTRDDTLIHWRKTPTTYQRINFADVFEQADGGAVNPKVPSMTGKIVIIGATAPSLHDTHPTPLSGTQAGVESLATGIDNALHRRAIWELPKWAGAVMAILMCAGIALWSHHRSVSSLAPAMVVLPGVLLGIGFVSLHTEHVFIDLHLSAGLAVLFLAVLKFWYLLRKRHWCGDLPEQTKDLVVLPWEADKTWGDDQLDRLMMCLQAAAPQCRLVCLDLTPSDQLSTRWRPFATCLALVGPAEQLQSVQASLLQSIQGLTVRQGAMVKVPEGLSAVSLRRAVSHLALQGWTGLQKPEST